MVMESINFDKSSEEEEEDKKEKASPEPRKPRKKSVIVQKPFKQKKQMDPDERMGSNESRQIQYQVI